jgi:hypothetical protein
MLDGLCILLRQQNFAGVKQVFAVNAEQLTKPLGPNESDRPQILVSRSGGDRNPTLEGNDGSLVNTDVDITVRDTNVIRASGIADLVIEYLEGAWPVVITCANGNREIVWVNCQEPNDLGQSPNDGSDNWDIGSKFTATIQHTPA